MQVTVRSERWMKRKTPTIETEDGRVHLQYEQIWRELRAQAVTTTVYYNNGEHAEANYWVMMLLWNGRPLIKRFDTSSSSLTNRVRALNSIKAKYEEGIYSGDFVVMKSHQNRRKHSWPIVFKSGIFHALIGQIDWVESAAMRESIIGEEREPPSIYTPTFKAWAKRNYKRPPNMNTHDTAKATYRLYIIYLLRQLGRRKCNHYLKKFQRRFTYLTYNKGKADVWERQHCRKKVKHDLTCTRSAWLLGPNTENATDEALTAYNRAMELMRRTLDELD